MNDLPLVFLVFTSIVAKTDLAGFNVDEVDPEEFRQTVNPLGAAE